MPAKSIKQRRLMAIAEHAPEKLFKKNKGILKMNKKQLHDFAKTPEKKLKMKKPKKLSTSDFIKRRNKELYGK